MLTVSVISPEATLYEGEATQVVAPAFDGEMGVLSGHAPLVALLGEGTLRIDTAAGPKAYAVRGGFVQVGDDKVRVVTEHAQAK